MSSLTIGVAPPWLATRAVAEPTRARRVLSWQRGHPLLRHVDLDELRLGGDFIFEAEAEDAAPGRRDDGAAAAGAVSDRLGDGPSHRTMDAEPLVIDAEGVVLATVEDRGARHASLAFPLRRSNLPALPAFPVLMQNAIDWLGAAGAGQAARSWRPGEPISVRARSDVARLAVRGPAGEAFDVPVEDAQRRVMLPPFERSGVWTVQGAVPEEAVVPVSQLSELESGLRVLGHGAGQADSSAAASGASEALPIAVMSPRDQRAPEPRHADRWPFAVAAALLLLLVEGLVWVVRAGRS